MDDDRVRASSFVARENELARTLQAVRLGSGAMVMGEAGVGKTSLAARAAARVGASGDPVVWTVATETSRAVPFGAFGPLLPEDVVSVPPTLLPPAIARTLRARGGRRRALLVVDDAQWLDEHSATALLGIVTQRAATVLATVRAGVPGPDAVTALWKDGLLERVDVGALDLDATRALLADRLGSEITNLTVALLWERTGGNPLYLTELIQFGEAEGRFGRDGSVCWWEGELGVPPRLAELLDQRFQGLSAAARDVVGALALGEPLPLDTLAAIAPGEALEEVEERGLVSSNRRHEVVQLRFAHPLLAAVANRTLSPVRRRRLVAALSGAAGNRVNVVRRASWQLDVPDPPDVELLLAGAAAVLLTDPRLTARFAERALPHDSGPRAALALADANAELGHPQLARHAAAVAAGRARTDEERLAVGLNDISLSTWSERRPAKALTDLRALRDRLPAEFEAELDSTAALITAFCARPADALALAERVLDRVPPHRAAVRASIPRISALILADRAREAVAVGDELLASIARAPVSPYDTGLAHVVTAWARLERWEGETVPAAGVASGRWPVPPADRGHEPDVPIVWPLLDGVRWHIEGHLPAAASRLREALAQQRLGEGLFRSEVVGMLAVVLAQTGQHEAAARLLAEEPPDDLAAVPEQAAWARAALAAARGDAAEAAELALTAAARAGAVGAVTTALWYLADAARYGNPTGAARLLDTMGDAFGSPLSQTRVAGIRARAAGAPPELLRAAEQHAAIGVWGHALELAKLAATAPGSDAPAQRTRAALLATELRTRLHLSAPAPCPAVALTARELEVARLASGGMTDREIAEALVVSVRTVESHLAAAYRKLGVRSRHQLHDTLGVG